MLVKQVMTRKLHYVRPDASFREIVDLLVREQISGVPVIDENEKLLGIVSEKDLLLNLFPSQKDFYKDPHYYWSHKHIESESKKIMKYAARDLMTSEIITVKPDDHILKACSLLLVHKIRRLPVVAKKRLVGIVTTNNIYRNYLQFLIKK